jgi:uncharacterized protein
MNTQWLSPKAEARITPGKGSGSFAIEPIAAGESVAGFGGYVTTRDVLNTLPDDQQHRSIQISDDLFMAPQPQPEPGDMINHSCEPNCVLLGGIVVIAWRDIAVGEELTFDYATCDDSDYDEFDCLCGAPNCRGRVTGHDWKLPALQEKYAGHFSPYLARRIVTLGR